MTKEINVICYLAAKSFNWNSHPFDECHADAIHNFEWWKLFRFYKIEVNDFQILLIDVTFYI